MPTESPSDQTSTIDSGPFGDADAHNANLDELHFVRFEGGGLSTKENDRRARILVGRKGSGKTLYLRRLRRSAADDPSLFALDREASPPGVAEAITVFERAGSPDAVKEIWPLVWRRAIIVSVASYILYDRRLERRAPAESVPEWTLSRNHLRDAFAQIGIRTNSPLDVGPVVTYVIDEHGQRGRLDHYLKKLEWQTLEAHLSDVMQHLPPFFVYLDNLDDTFQLAPKFWMACHEGLMSCVLSLHASARFANKLHVHITIRESVYSASLRSPHLTRYIQDKSIRHLAWNTGSILHFLNAKVQSLSSEFTFLPAGSPNNVEEWLGIEVVTNIARGIEEALDQYIIRHTRLLPRDVVIIGNTLAHRIRYLRSVGLRKFPMQDLREIVSACAMTFAKEQLQICSEYVVSHLIPKGAARGGYAETYTGDIAVQEWANDLRDLLVELEKDRVSKQSLDVAVTRFSKKFDVDEEIVLNSLWWSGLVGYRDFRGEDELHVFFTDENLTRHEFERDCDLYLLHPALLDLLSIKSDGPLPVTPC